MYTSTVTKTGENALRALALNLASELNNLAEDISLKAMSEVLDGTDMVDITGNALDCLKQDIEPNYRATLNRLEDEHVKYECVN